MKIVTKFLLCSVFGIVNVYPRGQDQVLDVQQSDDLNGFKMGILSTWHDSIQKDFFTSNHVNLYDNICHNTFFPPSQDSLESQIRVVFPTESLKNIWGNDNYWIGFSVICNLGFVTSISNTNWHRFTKPDKFDQNKKYTRITLRVGKCRNDFISSIITTDTPPINHIRLLYKIDGFKSKNIIQIGGNKKNLQPTPACSFIDNFHTILVSHIPDNSTDKPY